MAKEPTIVEPLEHDASGLTIGIVLHEGKRPYYTAEFHGVTFRNSNRELLERQINGALNGALALDWMPVIETRLKLAATEGTPQSPATLSLDRFWTLALPGGDLLRANWRTDGDDNRQRLARAYAANLPEDFGALPLILKTDTRQITYLPYTDAAWTQLQQAAARLRQQARAQAAPPAPVSPSQLSVFMPPRVTRYEMHYVAIERLISEHLDIDYSILAGEKWSPESSNALTISTDGYDDSDRAVIEQIRSGERGYFALEILMRVLVEQNVLPEGDYLITAR